MSVLHIPFNLVKLAAGVKVKPGTPAIPWERLDPSKEDSPIHRVERFRKWDSRPPANPSPPKKPDKKNEPDKLPKPKQPAPWKPDKDCQIVRDDLGSKDLKTKACIAENVAQAMTECYNRGAAAAKHAYKSSWANMKLCENANEDAKWMNRRLNRIILSQDKPQTHRRVVTSRNKP